MPHLPLAGLWRYSLTGQSSALVNAWRDGTGRDAVFSGSSQAQPGPRPGHFHLSLKIAPVFSHCFPTQAWCHLSFTALWNKPKHSVYKVTPLDWSAVAAFECLPWHLFGWPKGEKFLRSNETPEMKSGFLGPWVGKVVFTFWFKFWELFASQMPGRI